MKTEIDKDTLLEGRCLTPGSHVDTVAELYLLYPGAFDLTETVKNPHLVFNKDTQGVVYIIQQDNHEYKVPVKVYVYFDGNSFRELMWHDHSGNFIGSNTIVTLNTKALWMKLQLDCRAIFPLPSVRLSTEHYFSKESRNFHSIVDVKITSVGIYVSGNRKEDSVLNVGLLSFEDKELKMFSFPDWANQSTWRPCLHEEGIFFSDETSVYKLLPEEKFERDKPIPTVAARPKDVDVRLGKTHAWTLSPFRREIQIDMFGKENPDLFLFLSHGKGYSYLSDSRTMPWDFTTVNYQTRWIPFHDGFVEIIKHGGSALRLEFLYWKEGKWERYDFFKNESLESHQVRLFEKNFMGFYLGVDDERYFIDWEMVRSTIPLD